MNELNTTYRNPEVHRYLDTHIQDRHHSLLFDHILKEVFGMKANERVLEVGAGSGRYTEMLLGRGYQVLASEPDPAMLNKLKSRLGAHPLVTPLLDAGTGLIDHCEGLSLLCGFHVLHHLDDRSLNDLGRVLEHLVSESKAFRGWFFLEPNPLNPMYLVQIASTPGMSFSEESGTWRPGKRQVMATRKDCSVRMGNIGLFPPRESIDRLPDSILRWSTTLCRPRWPWSAYSVYGELNE